MSDFFNSDFKDFIKMLNKYEVEYVLIGGYTVMLYGYPRTTGDIDIWVEKDETNRRKIIKACHEFGLHTHDLTEQKFNDPSIEVFTFGRPPVCIDLIIQVNGFDFDDVFKNAVQLSPDGFPVKVVSYHDLIRMKKKSGRPKDLDDLNNIKEPK